MTRLKGIGTYVPYYRIQRSSIAGQHDDSPVDGETAVPSHDEDLVTMAFSAAEDALEVAGYSSSELDLVCAASVSDPFAERGIAAELARTLGADAEVRVADFGSSAHTTIAALNAARDALDAGRVETALVVATDVLPAIRGTDSEQTAGAGAGALVLAQDGIASIDDIVRNTTGYVDPLRPAGNASTNSHDRFNRERYIDAVTNLIKHIEDDIDRFAVAPPKADWGSRAAQSASISTDIDSTFDDVGYAGAASVLLDVALAYERADTGDHIALIAYGGGAASAVLINTMESTTYDKSMTIQDYIDSKEYVSYATHLTNRPEGS
jgi:3-hydroxy-3-methylglutaryl CoA synthase